MDTPFLSASAVKGDVMYLFRAKHRRPHSRRIVSPYHRIELLESRRLLSVAPLRPDLIASSDTGVSDVDNITRFDNATPGVALQFLVGGSIPGASVKLYLDNVAAGSSTASGPSTLATPDAGTKVLNGSHSVVARQAAAGVSESFNSAALSFTVDTTAPAAPAASRTD